MEMFFCRDPAESTGSYWGGERGALLGQQRCTYAGKRAWSWGRDLFPVLHSTPWFSWAVLAFPLG